jgi:hypothetical protein
MPPRMIIFVSCIRFGRHCVKPNPLVAIPIFIMTKYKVLIILIFASCINCVTQKYIGTYNKPNNVKVLGDGFKLNTDNSYHYFHLSFDDSISTFEEKGSYTIIENEYIIFYPDSIKDESTEPFRAHQNKKYYLDTLYIFNKGKDCILYGNWKCYMKKAENKPLDNDKYHKLCNQVIQNTKYGN